MAADEIEDMDWQPFFGYDETYTNQGDAIRSALRAGLQNGYLVMEGPCGTGKTMAALTAGAYLLRNTELYDNVVVVTPVKQQLDQFVSDLRIINAGLRDPFSGIALVGKTDLCPYEQASAFSGEDSAQRRCEDLRETTAGLVKKGSDADSTTPHQPSGRKSQIGQEGSGNDRWWDQELAFELVQAARVDGMDGSEPLVVDAAESPYPAARPVPPEGFTEREASGRYCPFEADWYVRDKGSPIGFDAGKHQVITSDEYFGQSVERGTCPHRVMGVLLESADFVIGNYNHLFDPVSRTLTARILDERTFVIVDEVHRVEERVRELLSDSIGLHSLRRARGDLDVFLQSIDDHQVNQSRNHGVFAEFDVSNRDVERAAKLYDDVIQWLTDQATKFLQAELGDFEQYRSGEGNTFPGEDYEIPLRDPEEPGQDSLSDWLGEAGYDSVFLTSLDSIGQAVDRTVKVIDPDRACVCAQVGVLMSAWWRRGHSTYFREITLTVSSTASMGASSKWIDVYIPRLVLYNCLPADGIASILGDLGGGIVMSATLEPIDVFREVTGLNHLSGLEDDVSRPVIERSYELPFPPKNRASWLIDAPAFTVRNRGRPDSNRHSDVREEYLHILRKVADSPGNVMICLPSYREASWAGEQLRSLIDKPVIVDRSSSTEVTNSLKEEFFGGKGKVLVTSTRGTLTEGVDYDGSKLTTCAVIGVPLVNIGSPRIRAVIQAYERKFGEGTGFEYALSIPAVRRSRQAIGRVIRGPDERGVRILVGNRYTDSAPYGSVHQYLSAAEREEFVHMIPMFLSEKIQQFWF